MALHFQPMIGGYPIGHFYAQRITGTTDPDSIGTYTVSITSGTGAWRGQVEHRYGDGAYALIARAITAAGLDKEPHP